ncbi:cytochrome P450 3A17-like [Rhopilema esculentum]|uniref:cytochrome P450 3A17-like n=1 Tax=Rhopilema esculentum TaxID=499914 RepID=UPI0031D5F315
MDAVSDVLTAVKEHWIITSLLLVTVLMYWHYVVNFTALKKLGIPGPTPLPLIGNSMTFIWNSKTVHNFFCDAGKKYGSIYGLYFLKQPMIIVAEPEIIKHVLVKEFEKFHDRPKGGLEFPEPLKSIMSEVKGQRWKDIRSIMTPAFTSGKLKGMMYIMNEAGDTLLKKIEKAAAEKQAVDIHEWQQSVTMEVILSAAFGTLSEAQTNPNDKVTTYAKDAMSPRPWPYIALMVPFIGKKISKSIMFSRFGFNWYPMIDIAKKILKQRRQVQGTTRNDVLQNMLKSQHPEKKGHQLTENELIAQMVLFLLAGYDTSSNVLCLTCYHLALYPEIQDKVYEEVMRICESKDTTTYDEIKEMVYLEACISETLRLYPPGLLANRTIDESCVINGVHFKQGMGVLIPIYALHRDEKYWPEPNDFKPERFLPENKESINQFTYLPFGDGPRNCIGMRFAQMEIRTILVRMLQKYRMVRGPETPVPLKVQPRAVLSPAEPVLIRFEKRE